MSVSIYFATQKGEMDKAIAFASSSHFKNVAFQNSMVKNHINKIMGIADQNALLSGLKTETMPKFQQELLNLVQQLVFQCGFAHNLFRLQTKELKNIGIADIQLRFRHFGCGMRKFGKSCFIFGQSGALTVKAVDLTLEFSHRPVASDALNFIESTFCVTSIATRFSICV